jgi:hypothetical protein
MGLASVLVLIGSVGAWLALKRVTQREAGE